MGQFRTGGAGVAPAMATQGPSAPTETQISPTIPEAEQEDHEASYAPEAADPAEAGDVDVVPLTFNDALMEGQLKTSGLGPGGAMIFPQQKTRNLVQ